jgi:hypothetical protein
MALRSTSTLAMARTSAEADMLTRNSVTHTPTLAPAPIPIPIPNPQFPLFRHLSSTTTTIITTTTN